VQSTTPVQHDGETIYVNTFTSYSHNHVFKAVGKISADNLVAYDLSSNYVKFDFGIEHFPYQGTTSQKTALALMTTIKGSVKEKEKVQSKSPSGKHEYYVQIVDDTSEFDSKTDPAGRFSWMQTATADGKEIDVLESTSADEDDSKTYWFTFKTTERPQSILWDPEIGAAYPGSASSNHATMIIVGFIGAAALVVALAVFGFKRRSMKGSSTAQLSDSFTEQMG
jgi:hypothetical protein